MYFLEYTGIHTDLVDIGGFNHVIYHFIFTAYHHVIYHAFTVFPGDKAIIVSTLRIQKFGSIKGWQTALYQREFVASISFFFVLLGCILKVSLSFPLIQRNHNILLISIF
jgi:hypothetical protein